MAVKESELEKYLVQVRRIAEHREVGAEQKIRQMYKELTEDLNSWLGNCYAKYAENDMLDFAILRQKGQYARFLEEVQLKIDGIYPELKSTVEELIDATYAVCWHGMYDGVTKTKRVEDLYEVFEASRAITPEQIKAAVQNPIPKLRLNPILERNRRQIIGNIRREIGVGLSNGDRMSTMARRISKHVDGDYNKAMRIARTESNRVREAGFNDAATRIDKKLKENAAEYRYVKVWKTRKNNRVRRTKLADHTIMEGQTVLQDEDFTLSDGSKAPHPLASGVAAQDCNCHCRTSHKLMNDAEFFEATGRHFPNKTVDKSAESGIIKSIDIDDFRLMSEIKGIDSEVVDTISSVVERYEKSNEAYINEFYFGSLRTNGNGTPLLQVEPVADRTLRLNVNTDVFGGKKLSEINDIVSKSRTTIARTLAEAVIHEYGHVKTIQGKTIAEIKELYDSLGKIHIQGINETAYKDGAECLAEIEILISRGENIPDDIMAFYNKYIGRKKL